MTSTERLWMTRQAQARLREELAALRSRPSIEVPDDFMDNGDNIAKYAARQTRIRQIQDLLANAVVNENPPDDGVAEPGMVLTVRYDDTGETEMFLLGVRGAEVAGIDVYSMQSPLGRAITGARPGEQRAYSVPSGAELPVTLLKAVPYGMHTPARDHARARKESTCPLRHVSGSHRRPMSGCTGNWPHCAFCSPPALRRGYRRKRRRCPPRVGDTNSTNS